MRRTSIENAANIVTHEVVVKLLLFYQRWKLKQVLVLSSFENEKLKIKALLVINHDQRCRQPYQKHPAIELCYPAVSSSRQVVSFFLTGRLGQVYFDDYLTICENRQMT